jgi:hypothetical protein
MSTDRAHWICRRRQRDVRFANRRRKNHCLRSSIGAQLRPVTPHADRRTFGLLSEKEIADRGAGTTTLLEPGDVVEVRKNLLRQKLPIARSETGNDPTRDSGSAEGERNAPACVGGTPKFRG